MNVVQNFKYNETQRKPTLHETYINKSVSESNYNITSQITDQITDLKNSIYSNLDEKYVSVENKLDDIISKFDVLMDVCKNISNRVENLEKKCDTIDNNVQVVDNKLSQYDIDDDQKSEDFTDDGLTDFLKEHTFETQEIPDAETSIVETS